MKFALGFLVCCFLVIAGTVVFAPEYAHKIIDRIHGNSESNGASSITPKDNSGASVLPSNEKTETVSESSVVPKDDIGADVLSSDEKPEPGKTSKGWIPPTEPRTKSEMLDWLKVHNYTVAEAEEQRSYRISWQNLKPVSPKPTAIVVEKDGTVIPQYGNHSVASGGSIVSVGDNNTSDIYQSYCHTTKGVASARVVL